MLAQGGFIGSLIHHDRSDLGSLIQIWMIPKERSPFSAYIGLIICSDWICKDKVYLLQTEKKVTRLVQERLRNVPRFIIWLNWSAMKRRILIGSLSGPNFAMGTAKMDRSRNNFGELLFQFVAQNRQFFAK